MVNLFKVGKFRYVGGIKGAIGDATDIILARIRDEWSKFKDLLLPC